MTIIGIFYLLLILGWIFLILVLKCKRARAKRLAEEQAAAAIAAQPCHVIQIGSNYYDIIPVSSSSHHNFSNYRSCANECNLQHQLANADSNNNITSSTTSLNMTQSNPSRNHRRRASQSQVTHTNQAFIMDEGGIYPSTTTCDLPPSYEDVMRLPTSYPKVGPSPFTPSYDEIMQLEYERNARNNLNSNGPAIIQVSATSTENHENNQIRSENQRELTTAATHVTSNITSNNNNNNASNSNQNVV